MIVCVEYEREPDPGDAVDIRILTKDGVEKQTLLLRSDSNVCKRNNSLTTIVILWSTLPTLS